jgi:hypothetical protein
MHLAYNPRPLALREEDVLSQLQTVEVRFPGERVASFSSGIATYTLYRTPESLYRVHIEEGERAWLESGRDGEGLPEEFARRSFPELFQG